MVSLKPTSLCQAQPNKWFSPTKECSASHTCHLSGPLDGKKLLLRPSTTQLIPGKETTRPRYWTRSGAISMEACPLSQSIWPKRCTTSTEASPWTSSWFPTSPPLKSSTYSFTSRLWASSTLWLFCLRTLDAQALTTSSMMMATLMTSSSSLPSTQTLSTIETWLEEMDRNSALTWIGSTLREQVPSGTRLWRAT